MFRVERRGLEGWGLRIRYGSYSARRTLEAAMERAQEAATTNAQHNQFGRYVVIDPEGEEVGWVEARPAGSFTLTTSFDEEEKN